VITTYFERMSVVLGFVWQRTETGWICSQSFHSENCQARYGMHFSETVKHKSLQWQQMFFKSANFCACLLLKSVVILVILFMMSQLHLSCDFIFVHLCVTFWC